MKALGKFLPGLILAVTCFVVPANAGPGGGAETPLRL
jgi:hypothetical protein